MKLNISDPKTSKTYKLEVDDKVKLSLIGKKIKDEIELNFIDSSLKGVITGGSNKQGFPMLSTLDVEGTKKILVNKGIGFKTNKKGERKRRRFAGRKITNNIEQVNIKLTSGDSKKLEEKLSKKEESKDKKEEKK